jgi:cell division protein FtsB
VGKLTRFFAGRKDLWHLQQELDVLRKENTQLKAQNDSMRSGMRRCVTCEYRIDYKQRQGSAPVLDKSASSSPVDDQAH